ncbi:NAD-dependent epimerase/dehydratase family protein [Epibacterium sp. SM1979]|uniref:NAD-dependent epimerase/dehydratase family protein n=1 Tax=Tritonibacter litoralis TaxID=2662264 RepID=A0A843YF79_9RHOB|nr:NAD(P)-dependent oxidoreductase [Tritonibacter litoralis]MQQ09551.1 NAD-dependent epimerase/dehydratase family protein [Tritonibacter litoralis]
MVTQSGQPETLILGASGRIGQSLCRFAHPAWRNRFRLQIRKTRGKAGPWHVFSPLSEPAELDRAAQGCKQILCLAGAVPGRGADLADNGRLALAAVDAAARTGCRRVLLTSSAAVYGRSAGPLQEDQLLEPANPYGEAKAAMEEAAQARGAELGVAVCALRIGNVAGFDAILGGWSPGFVLDQFVDGRTPRRSYVGVETLAHLLCDLMEAPDLPRAVNVAQPGPVAMGDLLQASDLAFATRPAPEAAIAEVAFDLSLLQSSVKAPVAPADPISLVAQWRAFCQ